MNGADKLKKILLIGAGAVNIGGAGELDFMLESALKYLCAKGHKTVILNPDAQAISNFNALSESVYTEPLTVKSIMRIIEKEKPDSIIPFFGGKIAMTLCHELAVAGILDKNNIRLEGISPDTIEYCEDAVKFKDMMDLLHIPTHEGKVVHTIEEAELAAKEYDYHVVIRSPYSTYSNANSLVFNKEELKKFIGPILNSSLNNTALISEALINRNEYEFEVMRDRENNIITAASVENVNPLDVHSSDSVIVTPVVSLSHKDYSDMEKAAYKIAEALNIVGIADVRFARNPQTGKWVVIKVTPMISKISAFASDAKGINSAEIEAQLISGKTLGEIGYNGKTMSDYKEERTNYTVRVPVFPFDIFPDAVDILDTKMRSQGSAVGVGKTFREALHKALRGAGIYGLGGAEKLSKEELLKKLITPSSKDLHYIYEALRKSAEINEISKITCIDEYFIQELKELLLMENRLLKYRGKIPVEPVLIKAKKDGFSDKYISQILSVSEREIRETLIDIESEKSFVKINDSVYSLGYTQAEKTDELCGKKALIVGGGVNRIGQSSELRFAAAFCAKALAERGYKTVYVNPGNVSDNIFDRVYINPITCEDIISICREETPDIIIVQFAGGIAAELTNALEENGFKVLGTGAEAYSLIGNKKALYETASKLSIPIPQSEISTDIDEALANAENIGYPVCVFNADKPSGKTVYTSGELLNYFENNEISEKQPVRIENFLYSAIGYEIDAIAKGTDIFIPEMMEHIESAGINTGDSACVLPPRSITDEQKKVIYNYAKEIVKELKCSGFINFEFAVDKNKIYLLNVSVGASRTLPFVSKACGINMIEKGISAMLGEIGDMTPFKANRFGVKEVVCPWDVFDECDPIMGSDMHSTGSVMSLGDSFGEAFFKVQEAAGTKIPLSGNVFINLSQRDEKYFVDLCRAFRGAGFKIFTTSEFYKQLEDTGIKAERIKTIDEGRPNIEDSIINGEIDIVINTAVGDGAIRQTVIKNSVFYMTTVSAAFAAVGGINTVKENI